MATVSGPIENNLTSIGWTHDDSRVEGKHSFVLTSMLVLYFFASGFTFVLAGETNAGSFGGRAAIPEMVLLAFLFFSMVLVKGLSIPKLGLISLGMMAVFCFATIIAAFTRGLGLNPNIVIVEILVHVFLIVGFMGIYRYCSTLSLDRRVDLLVWWTRIAGLLALIGVWDFFSSYFGLPAITGGLIPHRSAMADDEGEIGTAVVGTFRNTGQAGAFYSTALACALATVAAVRDKSRLRFETIVWSAVLLVALVLTLKRAAIMGTSLGLIVLIMRERGVNALKMLLLYGVIGGLLWLSIPLLMDIEGGFAGQLTNKFSESGGEQSASFIHSNWEAVESSLAVNPLTGAGILGTVVEKNLEVHSTYLKVLGDTGVIGSVAYCIFLFYWFRSCTFSLNSDIRSSNFSRVFTPLLIGLIVSWGYTYHLRKREFWISTALVVSLMAPIRLVNEDSDETI